MNINPKSAVNISNSPIVAMLFISVSGDIATNIAAMSPTFLSNSSFPRKYVGNTMNAPPIAVDARNMVIVEL